MLARRTFWLLGLLAGLAAAADRPVVEVPQATAPKLDGRLDDPCWAEGPWLSGFTLLNAPDRPAIAQTHYQVCCDGTALYFGVKLDEPDMAELKATVADRDGKVHHDDCLEILIDPNGDQTEHYHFTVNSLGTLYDSEVRQGGNVMSLGWNADWQAAVAKGDDFWSVECRIPLAELPLDAGSRGTWGFNLCRERQAGQSELSSFAATTGGFHQPAAFAGLKLTGVELAARLWQLGRPAAPQVVDRDGLQWTAKTYLQNQTGKFRFFRATASISVDHGEPTSATFTDGLDHQQGRSYDLTVPIQGPGHGLLTLQLADRESGELLAQRKFELELRYSPLTITLTEPCYRNCIFATQTINQVVGTVAIGLAPEKLQGCALWVGLVGERTMAEVTIAKPLAETPFTLPTGDLPVGDYQLTARLKAADGQLLHEGAVRLRKLAPHSNEVRLDEHLVTRLNGQPFLPFGWFSIGVKQFDEAARAGYNALIDYNAYWRTDEEQQAFLDAVVAAGLKVACYPYPNRRFNDAETWGKPLTDEEAEAVRLNVRKWKDHPALLAWYMADEPELRPALTSRAEALRAVCEGEDPYHPCIMLNDTVAGIYKYAFGGDILMPDPYPLFVKDGFAGRGLDHVGQYVEAIGQAGDGRRGAWVTPQAFNYGDYGRVNNRAPNFTELRNMLYQSVIERATGFLWYTYGQTPNYPQLKLGVSWLAQEAKLLQPVILSPQTSREVKVEPADGKLKATLREVDGQWYLLAVNTATEPVDAALHLPEGSRVKWYVISEGRSVTAAGGVLKDHFELYDTNLYTTDPVVSQKLDLAGEAARIAAADKARQWPGNLAFEGRGTTVQVSSKSRYGSTPDRVVDGVLYGMAWRDGTSKKYPDWLQLDFKQEENIGRVVVYSATIDQATVQVPDGEGWRDLGGLQREDEHKLSLTCEPIRTKALRLNITAGLDSFVAVTEVEAYAK